MQVAPFEKLRGRTLIVRALLALIVSAVIADIFWPEWTEKKPTPLPDALFGLLLYGLFFLFTSRALLRARLSYNRLFGTFPAASTLRQYSLWTVPLIIFSLSSFLVLYFPLSVLLPGFFEQWFIENSPDVVLTAGDNYVLSNLLNFCTIVLVAPVAEEFFVRGILLTRWTIKWGVRRSILASSIVFALLHSDVVGAFCFACVMAIFYIRTQSLFIPIAVHIVNNGLVWIIEYLAVQSGQSHLQLTIENYQELWWIGLVGFAIIIPCAIYFWKHYLLKTNWRVPYLVEPVNAENNASSNVL